MQISGRLNSEKETYQQNWQMPEKASGTTGAAVAQLQGQQHLLGVSPSISSGGRNTSC